MVHDDILGSSSVKLAAGHDLWYKLIGVSMEIATMKEMKYLTENWE